MGHNLAYHLRVELRWNHIDVVGSNLYFTCRGHGKTVSHDDEKINYHTCSANNLLIRSGGVLHTLDKLRRTLVYPGSIQINERLRK